MPHADVNEVNTLNLTSHAGSAAGGRGRRRQAGRRDRGDENCVHFTLLSFPSSCRVRCGVGVSDAVKLAAVMPYTRNMSACSRRHFHHLAGAAAGGRGRRRQAGRRDGGDGGDGRHCAGARFHFVLFRPFCTCPLFILAVLLFLLLFCISPLVFSPGHKRSNNALRRCGECTGAVVRVPCGRPTAHAGPLPPPVPPPGASIHPCVQLLCST